MTVRSEQAMFFLACVSLLATLLQVAHHHLATAFAGIAPVISIAGAVMGWIAVGIVVFLRAELQPKKEPAPNPPLGAGRGDRLT